MDPIAHEVWKALAGPYYDELVQSQEKSIAHLSHVDSQVRMAAINICDLFWDCSTDGAFVEACRAIAMTDPDEFVRSLAIGAFGKAFQSSRDPVASQFLAGVVKASETSARVRMAAYWALREVQIGSTLQDKVVSL
jgi:hypothetical protein